MHAGGGKDATKSTSLKVVRMNVLSPLKPLRHLLFLFFRCPVSFEKFLYKRPVQEALSCSAKISTFILLAGEN
jgi:hypothetical protein